MKRLLLAVVILLFISLPLYAQDSEVQDLTDITTPVAGDDMYIVDDPDGTPVSRKINVGVLLGVATDLDTGGAVSANAVALTTNTTGNYSDGDAEAGNALIANTSVIVDSTDATSFPLMTDSATGNLAVKTDGGLLYNSSTGNLQATQHGGITEANLVDKSASEAVTGGWDYGGAPDLEMPNSATPTVDTTGQFALDTTITDHEALVEYFGTSTSHSVIAIRTSLLPATDNQIIKYDAALDQFVLEADAGGAETNSLETTITGIVDTEVFIGNGADSGTFAVFSGDVGLANNGATTVDSVQANAIDSDAYVDGSIDLAHMSSQSVDSDNIVEDTIVNADINSAAAIVGSKIVDATTSVEGSTEHATTAEIDAGTDSGRSMTPGQFEGSDFGKAIFTMYMNGDTALTTGDGKVFERLPDAFAGWSITGVNASRSEGSGTDTYNLYNFTQGTDTLSTALTIDAGELDSGTAEVPAVINTDENTITLLDQLRADVDVVGTDTKHARIQVELQRIE